MKKLIFLLIILPQMAFAALPPYFATAREIKEIVDSNELHTLLGSGKPIDSIERKEEGWIVKSGEKTITVVVHYNSPMPGPGNIQLEFKPAP